MSTPSGGSGGGGGGGGGKGGGLCVGGGGGGGGGGVWHGRMRSPFPFALCKKTLLLLRRQADIHNHTFRKGLKDCHANVVLAECKEADGCS